MFMASSCALWRMTRLCWWHYNGRTAKTKTDKQTEETKIQLMTILHLTRRLAVLGVYGFLLPMARDRALLWHYNGRTAKTKKDKQTKETIIQLMTILHLTRRLAVLGVYGFLLPMARVSVLVVAL